MKKKLYFLFAILIIPVISAASINEKVALLEAEKDSSGLTAKYGKKGFEFKTNDNRFSLQLRSRLQFRFLTPYASNPRNISQLEADPVSTFRLQRARLKVGGHGFQPWIKYYWEYDVAQNRILNYTISVEKYKKFSVMVGQWKVDYSRERRISSGKQMHVDRSIVNRPFTLDRQQGVCFYGHFDGAGANNFQYWASILTGTGRSTRTNDDDKLMYVGRLQWNALNGGTDMSGSDLKISPKPRLSIAVGGATDTSAYTRFSSGGPGSLDGYSTGLPGQYEVNQGLVEASFKYKGFNFEHEYHMKTVNDKVEFTSNTLTGYYIHAGYFFHQAMSWVPEPLELALRYAEVNPNTDDTSLNDKEVAVAVNWFFSGHNNKLSADFGWFQSNELGDASADGTRVRVQWDISF